MKYLCCGRNIHSYIFFGGINEMNFNGIVIAHLFYEDLLAESISYLMNVPHTIDILITTPAKYVAKVRLLLEEIGRLDAKVIPAGPNGRDVAALLVTAHEYLLQYDYLCFVHDKKTTGGVGDPIIGEVYRNLIWKNLLGSKDTIYTILQMFQDNPALGIIAPPRPYHDQYFLCMGDRWVKSFETTQRILRRLQIERTLSRNDQPLAISMAFWCRTKALAKLFLHTFHYKDFPLEPLALEGSINHAIEHAISLIAEDSGYETKIYSNPQETYSIMMEYEEMLSKLSGALAEQYFFTTLDGLIDEVKHKTLMKFCKLYPRLYVYGAGYHGNRLLKILEKMGYSAEGFVVSNDMSFPQNAKLHCYHIADLNRSSDIGIIVAVAHAYQSQIWDNLAKLDFDKKQCYFLV